MVLSMPSPYKHPKTGVYWYRQRVPAALRAKAAGRVVSVTIDGLPSLLKVGAELKVSLRTKEPQRAKELAKEAETQFDLTWSSFTSGPVTLTMKQCVALSGEIYRTICALFEDDARGAARWAQRRRVAMERARNWKPGPRDALKIGRPRTLRERWGTWVDGALADHHLTVDAASYDMLLTEFDRAFGLAAEMLERRAAGDFSPDPNAERFPAFERPSPVPTAPVPAEPVAMSAEVLTLTALLNHREQTQSQKARTYDGYRSRVRDFAKFLGHEDARRVTRENIRDWRDSLQKRGLSIKTINDGYLTALKAALSHGEEEFGIASVAARIRDKRDASAPTGRKDYTKEQAQRILSATFGGTTKDLSIPHRRALFWAPWIMAYTGLRVGEVTQLQGRSLRWDGDIPVLLITPEDGSTKGGAAWAVGVHQHLIDLGLLKMLAAVGDGPAFYTPYPTGTDLRSLKDHRRDDASADVGNWIVEALGEPAPLGRPNHAWRHTFTTLSRDVGMNKEARDFMMGSRSKVDAREGYGEWKPAVLSREINRLPRFNVQDTGWRPSNEVVPSTPTRSKAAPRLGRRAGARTV